MLNRNELQKTLSAEVILDGGAAPETCYDTVCACDMMSELLAMMNHTRQGRRGIVLLTGLSNPQVIRTAEMVDIHLIVFVRDRKPAPETLDLAGKCGITLLSTPHTMYKSCGVLYEMKLGDVELESGTA